MSLDRAALRLATVMALTNGYTGPYPTMAGPNVYDSRVDPIEGGNVGELAPLAMVFTDDDDGEQLSMNNGGPPFRHTINLIFELSIGMVGELVDANGAPLQDADGNPVVGLLPIATEPELEIMLDLFEWQVRQIFARPWGATWSNRLLDTHIARVVSWSSARFVEREGQRRLAVRQIMLKVELPQEGDIDPTQPTPETVPEPLGSLLQEIIDGAGPYAASAEAMQDLLVENGGFAAPALPPLNRVRLKEADLGGGNLAGVAAARPDGVAQATIPQD